MITVSKIKASKNVYDLAEFYCLSRGLKTCLEARRTWKVKIHAWENDDPCFHFTNNFANQVN